MSKMFFGCQRLKIDAKNRIFINQDYRSYFDDSAVIFLDEKTGCIKIYTVDLWEKFLETLESAYEEINIDLVDAILRKVQGNARTGKFDKDNRLTVPSCALGVLDGESDITLLGNGDHIEVWSTSAYERAMKAIEEIDPFSVVRKYNYKRKKDE